MRFVGSKYLDRNDYSHIAINNGDIIVSGNKSKYKGTPSGYSFTDECKGLSNEEKIAKVVEYFLDYHTLTSISVSNGYQVNSADGTTLNITGKVSNKIVKKIKNKYKEDRERFAGSINFYESKVEFIAAESSSGFIEDARSCRFYIETRRGRVNDNEKVFLMDVFDEMLFDGEVIITREDMMLLGREMFNVSFLRKNDGSLDYVDYGAPRVCVSKGLMPIIETLVEEHNESFSKENKDRPKQLRLEEFK